MPCYRDISIQDVFTIMLKGWEVWLLLFTSDLLIPKEMVRVFFFSCGENIDLHGFRQQHTTFTLEMILLLALKHALYHFLLISTTSFLQVFTPTDEVSCYHPKELKNIETELCEMDKNFFFFLCSKGKVRKPDICGSEVFLKGTSRQK